MIKDDLAKRLAADFALSQALAARIVQTLLDTLTAGLISDGNVELRQFGVFGIKQQKPRVITLPSGKKITRPAQKVVTFAPSPAVKKKLNPPPARRLKPRIPVQRENELIEEIRKIREDHAKRFNYDLEAIYRDLKEAERKSGRKFAVPPRKRKARVK